MQKSNTLYIIIGIFLLAALAFVQYQVFGAPASNILRNILPENNLQYEIGSSSPAALWLRIYTQNASTSALTVSGLGNTATRCLQITNQGIVQVASDACGTGGSASIEYNPFSAASFVGTSTATSTLTGGIYATLISAPIFHATSTSATSTLTDLFFVDAQGTTLSLSGAASITCTSCITDANVTDVLTIGATGSVDDGALSANVAHLNVAETIASNWVNTANPWADDEVVDALTVSAGTINNSTIGATTQSTAKLTTLSTTGLYSLYGNLTGTSTIDFSGGLFKGVSSSSLTTLTAGEQGIDTTSGKFVYRDSNTSQVLSATSTFGFVVSSTTLGALGAYDDSSAGTTTIRVAGEWNAVTITAMRCTVTGTSTSATVSTRLGDGNASSSFALANQAGQVTLLSSNNSFILYEDKYLEIGSKVQAPDTISCSFMRKIDQD